MTLKLPLDPVKHPLAHTEHFSVADFCFCRAFTCLLRQSCCLPTRDRVLDVCTKSCQLVDSTLCVCFPGRFPFFDTETELKKTKHAAQPALSGAENALQQLVWRATDIRKWWSTAITGR